MKRLSAAIVSWRDCLVGNEDESTIDTSMDTKPVTAGNQFKLGGAPEVEVKINSVQKFFKIQILPAYHSKF